MSRTAISPRFATSTGPVIRAPVLRRLIYRSYGSLWAMTLPTTGPPTAGGRSGSPATGPAAGEHVAESRRRHAEALEMGGSQAVDRHRASGRLPVRERIALLLDEGSWFETGVLAQPERRTGKKVPGDGVVTGFGRVDGRTVGLIGIDATVLAGTTALPLDFKTFLRPRPGEPPVPRAAAVLGPSYGDSALHASTAHFVVMTESAAIALSGPSVIEAAIGEQLTDTALGGPDGAQAAGNAHMAVEAEADAFEAIAAFLSYLPSSAASPAPAAPPAAPATDPAELASIVPAASRSAYDMHRVLEAIADRDSIFPWGAGWGPSLITALVRIEGQPAGLVASQPLTGAGALDPAALAKETKFVDLCDTFNLPLVFLHDVPGLMIGTQAERGGILHAYEGVVSRIAAALVPKVGVVLRKAYGGGHFAMGGRPTHPDFLFAWPSAELGFMAPATCHVYVEAEFLGRLAAPRD